MVRSDHLCRQLLLHILFAPKPSDVHLNMLLLYYSYILKPQDDWQLVKRHHRVLKGANLLLHLTQSFSF